MPTGIELSAGIVVGAAKPVDAKYGPYASTAAALADIPAALRYSGLTVGVVFPDGVKEYWFKLGTQDSNFIEKTTAGSATNGVISKTYSELKALRASSSLIQGQYYKITDYQTKWYNQTVATYGGSYVLTSPVVEPLTILAIASNKFSPIAYSELYPEDIIYYDFEETINRGMRYTGTISGLKGWINRRVDTSEKNIDIPFDWRHITVNCCRADLSGVPEWDSTATYDTYNVVKLNNKVYFSVKESNVNNLPSNGSTLWRPFTGFNEGLTYFATNETNIFKAYKPDGTELLTLYADVSTRTQKYMFDGAGAEQTSTGGNVLTYVVNVKIEGASCSNIFVGPPTNIRLGSAQFNTIGLGFQYNEAGEGFNYNIIANYASGNNFGIRFYENLTNVHTHPSQRFIGNTFTIDTYRNIFGILFSSNVCGELVYHNLFPGYFNQNNIKGNFYRNLMSSNYFRRNEIGDSFYYNDINSSFDDNIIQGIFYSITANGPFYNNVIAPTFRDSTFNGYFRQNIIQGNFFENTFNGDTQYNVIGTQCHYVTVNGLFDYNTIAPSFSHCTIGSASYNTIGSFFRSLTLGNNFRKNVVEDEALFSAGDLTSATHIYNTYSCRIFKNASNVAKLSYFNASDIQTIVLPTA